MKLILVDASKTYLARLRRRLAAAIPTIEVTEYDAEQQGMPGADFRWDLYDAALLSHELGDGVTGLDWLARYRHAPGFPPVVLVAGSGDEYLAVAALKAGAADYLRRADLRTPRLVQTVEAVLAQPRAMRDATVALDDFVLQSLDRIPITETIDSTGHRFVRLIGQGGSSRVYLAERRADGAMIVLKVIDTQQICEPTVIQRFVREAEIVASLNDPHVVKIFDQGFTPDCGYISMEFFQRGDLKQRIEQGVALPAAVDYMRSIARGLEAIHAREVIHRDLKPGNIMFRADDSLALADFGISKRVNETLDLTTTGVIGTPSYISPEQASGGPISHRTDLYSAGVIFFELLTGRKPFRADSPAALVHQHIHVAPPRLPDELEPVQPIL
ncbi:MAG: serine/threonine-protein kinase, partial [Gammaproteobacteria bacterium]